MKKIYLLITIVMFSLLSYGQVYLYEDFSAGTMPPSGWSFDGLPNQWSNNPSNNAGGSAPEAMFTYIQQTTTSRFVSPVLDMTGVNNVTLMFKHFYDYYAGGPKIGVATRTNGGAWTNVWEITPTTNIGPKSQVVSMTNVGQSNFQFCFYITGNLYNVDYWFIDNIKLFVPLALDASLEKVDIPKYIATGTSFNVEGTVANEGSTAINSFNVSYTVDGGSPVNFSVTNVNIPLGGTYDFAHPTAINLEEIGSHQIVTTISNVNGGQDLNIENNTITKPVGVVEFVPTKMVLAEEATGTWCQWCPRGTCFMNTMAETYPETWIGVAVHNGDPMVVPEYDNAISQIIPGFAGYPSVTTDRTPGDSDPTDLENAYFRRIEAVSPATITIENYSWNPATRVIAFDLQSEFVANVSADLRYGVIFAEDSLWGTTSQWAQKNSYANNAYGPMCGFESLPSTVPASQMHYDHVARAIIDSPFGTPESIPNPVEIGQVTSYHYEYTLPASWRYEKLHVIGFLSDVQSNEILNATNVISSWIGINNPDFEKQVSLYPNPSAGLTNVSFYMDKSGKASVQIFDTFGKMVYSVDQKLASGENTMKLNTSMLSDGIYILKLTIDNKSISKKLSIAQ